MADQRVAANKADLDENFIRGVAGARNQAQWEKTPRRRREDAARMEAQEREQMQSFRRTGEIVTNPEAEIKFEAKMQNHARRDVRRDT